MKLQINSYTAPTLLFFILLLSACSFPTKIKRLSGGQASSEKQLNLITSTGYDVKVDRKKFIGYLDENMKEKMINFDSLYKNIDTVKIDSALKEFYFADDLHFYTNIFVKEELSSEKAMVLDLTDGKYITRFKRKTTYYKYSAFRKGQTRSVDFYSDKKIIYTKKYTRVCF
jgi:hypothetical protein